MKPAALANLFVTLGGTASPAQGGFVMAAAKVQFALVQGSVVVVVLLAPDEVVAAWVSKLGGPVGAISHCRTKVGGSNAADRVEALNCTSSDPKEAATTSGRALLSIRCSFAALAVQPTQGQR